MPKKVTVVAISPIAYDGDRYAPGRTLQVDAATADELRACGAAADPEAAAEADNVVPLRGGAPPQQTIVHCIEALLAEDSARADEALWTRDGKPDATVLSERIGARVSAAARDAAWAEYQARSAPDTA